MTLGVSNAFAMKCVRGSFSVMSVIRSRRKVRIRSQSGARSSPLKEWTEASRHEPRLIGAYELKERFAGGSRRP